MFTNDPEFEVELEYIGNKMRYKGDPEEVLNEFITNTGIVLQSIQNTYYLTSEKQKNEVRSEYKAMFKNFFLVIFQKLKHRPNQDPGHFPLYDVVNKHRLTPTRLNDRANLSICPKEHL